MCPAPGADGFVLEASVAADDERICRKFLLIKNGSAKFDAFRFEINDFLETNWILNSMLLLLFCYFSSSPSFSSSSFFFLLLFPQVAKWFWPGTSTKIQRCSYIRLRPSSGMPGSGPALGRTRVKTLNYNFSCTWPNNILN